MALQWGGVLQWVLCMWFHTASTLVFCVKIDILFCSECLYAKLRDICSWRGGGIFSRVRN